MNKRDFLKASGALLTTALLPGISSGEPMYSETPTITGKRTNWSGNYTYSTDKLFLPASTEEVQHIVKAAPKLRTLGTTHSFNGIADSTVAQISLKGLDSMVLDRATKTVTVGGGVPYGKLAPYIDSRGFAVHNLASLPHISVAGACSTGTHGSGIKNGNLSTSVSGLEIVRPDGEIVHLSRQKDGDAFKGVVVSIGALGVITKVTLDVEPTFQVAQTVYQNLSFDRLKDHFDEIMGSGYSVSLFTDWQNHRVTQVWIKRRIEAGAKPNFDPQFFGATLATKKLHPLEGHNAEACTEQMGIPGPWYERLPHFRMAFTPSSGQELQSEYFVPREHAYEAVLAVEQIRDLITPHLFITELRTIAEDDLWISPCYKRPSLAIHFTWKPEWPEVQKVLPHIEEKLAPFNARPHWAKLFTMAPDRLHQMHPRLADFRKLTQTYDPTSKFHNAFMETNIFKA